MGDGDPEKRYLNWRHLGRGGTAMVYRVYDASLEYDVAIKLLHEQLLEDFSTRPSMLRSLVSEVRISRELRHDNICGIHDLYQGPEGTGVVMDIVEGGELHEWMKLHANNRLATAPERLELFRRLTAALAYAHTKIVHRDLKPSNIFLRDRDVGRPVIMDFGFSVLGARVSEDSSLALTPKYAAPEQYLTPHEVDRRADLWALGMIAYELFAGQVPPCSLKDVLKTRTVPRIPLEQIEPPSRFNAAVPVSLDRIILQAMHYDADRRLQSADDLLAALNGIELIRNPLGIGEDGQPVDDMGSRRSRAVRLEGGTYYLGSRAGPGTNKNELPGLRVQLTPFLIDPTPVTNTEYVTFAAATGYPLPPMHNRKLAEFGRHPVVGITHAEALAYARWVGGSLPTEAQWEYAARAGENFAEYPWGAEPPGPALANIDRIATGTTPVGSFIEGRNGFGLDDCCGNVWEWCLDSYEEDFFRFLAKDTINPVNLRKTGDRSLRGGSFEDFAVMGRCAFRGHANPNDRRNNIGFRVVYQIER